MRNDFNYRCSNLLASTSQLLLLLAGVRIGTRTGWLFCFSTICVASLLLWAANFRRSRIVADTPTSRVASAPQGYVELFGRAKLHSGTPLISPVSLRTCVWFRYQIEEKSGNEWRTIEHAMSPDTFVLEDETGQAIIDPDYAEVVTTDKRSWKETDRRYTEWLLTPGAPLYALGEFTTRGGEAGMLDRQADLNALLTEWKADRQGLLERFDLNHDGQIDLKEWQLARQAAQREITRQHKMTRALPGIHVLHKPDDARPLLLANLDPDQMARRYGVWTMLQLLIAIGSMVGLVMLATTFAPL